MDLILARRKFIEIPWESDYGPGLSPGDLFTVPEIYEVGVIDNFENYNNVISLTPTLQENDWELQISIEEFQKLQPKIHDWIYIRDSEFGGIVENIERVDRVVKLSGANFRGYLHRHIVTPFNGINTANGFADYLRVKIEANRLLWLIFYMDLSERLFDIWIDPYVVGLKEDTGVVIEDQYRFDNYLSAMQKSLRKNGMRLETKQVYVDYDNFEDSEFATSETYRGERAFVFSLAAKKVTNYSEEDLFSQDYDIRINSGNFTQDERDYLFCLGQGNLEDREIAVLYMGEETFLGTGQTAGSHWNAAIFDYPNAEDRDELIKAGKERYFEMHQKEEYIEMFVDDDKIEFFLGDIISGADFITGIKSSAEIVSKELTISDGKSEILYKIGGR